MAKPRLIILVRHAQSEGNKNREIHQTIPDHRVKLTQDGWQQAYEAGRRLRAMLRADDTLHFFTSPYRRTRETTEGILQTLTSDEPEPSPFKRNNIKVYEEPRLREQDFGNFQPCSAEMERMWQERADYGHFFYRIPNGESAADAYDRVSGFNESLWRQFGEDDFASVCVLVTHGLMSRVFLMKWYHFSVEYFEDLRNVNHCEFLIMQKEENGKYKLQTKLRTWSELRRERAALQKQKEAEAAKDEYGNGIAKEGAKLEKAVAVSSPPPIAPRRWGGCPNGCNHDKNFKIRSGYADLVKRDGTAVYGDACKTPPQVNGSANSSSSSLATRRPAARRFQTEGNAEPNGVVAIDVTRAREEVVSSPDATPSFITVEVRERTLMMQSPPFLHVGRDFGGTYSGHTSDADSSEDDSARGRMARLKINGDGAIPVTLSGANDVNGVNGVNGHANGHADGHADGHSFASLNGAVEKSFNGTGDGKPKREHSGMGHKIKANRLGDAPHSDSEHEHCDEHSDEHDHDHDHVNGAEPGPEKGQYGPASDTGSRDGDDELAKEERRDKSIQGSVY